MFSFQIFLWLVCVTLSFNEIKFFSETKFQYSSLSCIAARDLNAVPSGRKPFYRQIFDRQDACLDTTVILSFGRQILDGKQRVWST